LKIDQIPKKLKFYGGNTIMKLRKILAVLVAVALVAGLALTASAAGTKTVTPGDKKVIGVNLRGTTAVAVGSPTDLPESGVAINVAKDAKTPAMHGDVVDHASEVKIAGLTAIKNTSDTNFAATTATLTNLGASNATTIVLRQEQVTSINATASLKFAKAYDEWELKKDDQKVTATIVSNGIDGIGTDIIINLDEFVSWEYEKQADLPQNLATAVYNPMARGIYDQWLPTFTANEIMELAQAEKITLTLTFNRALPSMPYSEVQYGFGNASRVSYYKQVVTGTSVEIEVPNSVFGTMVNGQLVANPDPIVNADLVTKAHDDDAIVSATFTWTDGEEVAPEDPIDDPEEVEDLDDPEDVIDPIVEPEEEEVTPVDPATPVNPNVNPGTGVAIAIVPALAAGAAVLGLGKKRK